MFCSKCGAFVEEGTLFCGKCGNKVDEYSGTDGKTVQANSVSENKSKTNEYTPSQGMENQNNQSKGMPNQMNQSQRSGSQKGNLPSNRKKMYAIGGGIAGVALIAVIIFMIFRAGDKTIDLNDYCKVEFRGKDTGGYVEYEFDQTKFQEDVLLKEGVDADELDNWSSVIKNAEEYMVVDKLKGTFNVSIDKQEELKNGDLIHINFKIDEEKAKELGYNLIGETKEIKVAGLDPVEDIDPFEDIEVIFKGVSPYVTLLYKNNSTKDLIKDLKLYCDDSTNIKKGDKITLRFDCEKSRAAAYGYHFTQESKTYECKDVNSLLYDSSELTEERLKGMQEQSQKTLDMYFTAHKKSIKADEYKYEGYYLLKNKNDSKDANVHNYIYILYSTQVTSLEKQFEPTKIYFPFRFTNVMVTPDGKIQAQDAPDSKYDIVGENELKCWYFKLRGQYDIKKVYDDVITKNMANFDYVMTDGLKALHGEK